MAFIKLHEFYGKLGENFAFERVRYDVIIDIVTYIKDQKLKKKIFIMTGVETSIESLKMIEKLRKECISAGIYNDILRNLFNE